MNKKTVWCLIILAAMFVAPAGLAKGNLAQRISISEAGPLLYRLPENPVAASGQIHEEYVITWEPVENAHAFYIGAVQERLARGSVFYQMAEGWLGSDTVLDGEGKKHEVQNAVFDSIRLEGTATEIDLAPLLNKFETANGESAGGDDGKAIASYVVVLIVPKSGEPVRQLIELPISAEAAD